MVLEQLVQQEERPLPDEKVDQKFIEKMLEQKKEYCKLRDLAYIILLSIKYNKMG